MLKTQRETVNKRQKKKCRKTMFKLLKYRFFIKKIIGYDFPLYRGECREKWCSWVHEKKAIYISGSFLQCSTIEQRAMLLHECGHIAEGIDYRNLIKTEAEAWSWAIKRGNELGLKEEVELIKSWIKYWESVKGNNIWNSNRRRYILAARLIQKS